MVYVPLPLPGAGWRRPGAGGARLRRVPDGIVLDTWANRAQRTRQPRSLYQAGTKVVVKRPGEREEGPVGMTSAPGEFYIAVIVTVRNIAPMADVLGRPDQSARLISDW